MYPLTAGNIFWGLELRDTAFLRGVFSATVPARGAARGAAFARSQARGAGVSSAFGMFAMREDLEVFRRSFCAPCAHVIALRR